MPYDPSVPFTAEQINLIELSFKGIPLLDVETPIGVVRDFYQRFPDQELDTAIGGALMELEAIKKGMTTPLVSDLQDTVPDKTARGEAPNDSPAASPVGLSGGEEILE